jgi:DNA repair protein RadC
MIIILLSPFLTVYSLTLSNVVDAEQFFILLLNRAKRVIGISEISSGGFAGTVVDPKVIFFIA